MSKKEEEGKKKSIDEAVVEVEEQIAGALNQSGLPLSIVRLVLRNILLQVDNQELRIGLARKEEKTKGEGKKEE